MNVELKRYKKEYEHSYSYGVFPTLELLHSRPDHVIGVLVSTKGARNEGVQKIEALCKRRRIAFEVNDRAVDRLADKENVYAIGVFSKYQSPLHTDESHLVLVNPGDMGNLGTIARTMVGFEVRNLALVRPAVDIFDPRVVRSSMGAIFKLAFQYFDSFGEYRSLFIHNVYPFMTNGKANLDGASFQPPFALVFGNESSGLPDEYQAVGTSVTIPYNSDDIDSLSLPVAAGIALYEARKVILK